MENKSERKKRTDRLKKLSAEGITMEELIGCVISMDPEPLWEQKKAERAARERGKRKKKETSK